MNLVSLFTLVTLARAPRPGLTTITLAAGDKPPTEVRLFAAGANTTEKGTFLFDAKAASLVMAAYEKRGTDVMIDLEHQALDGAGPDPTARDARAWGKLEVRNGELWLTNIKWTPDGARRLSEKTQRYLSPAFALDAERRIVDLVNVALVAMPATHDAPALVAAAGNAPPPSPVEPASPADVPAFCAQLSPLLGLDPKKATPEQILAAVESLVNESEPGDANAEAVAASRLLCRLAGSNSPSEAVTIVRGWRASHAQLAVLEEGERRTLLAEMVTRGFATPATVFDTLNDVERPAGQDTSHLPPPPIREPWASMALSALRDHVTTLRKSTGPLFRSNVRQPVGGEGADGEQTIVVDGAPVVLTAREVRACTEKKLPLDKYARERVRAGLK